MKFGVMELFQHPKGKTTKEVIDDAVDLAVTAEALGFDSIWLAEHHFSTYGLVGSPLIVAAAIAQRTTRIKIGTAVLVLPLYNPIRLAEEIALVDQMSGGRLQIGVGRGYLPEEFQGFSVDQEHSRELAEEALQIMKQAWTRDIVDFTGQHFTATGVSILPKPMQSPHPPVYQAAVSMSSFEKAGSEGSPILTSPNFTPVETVRKQFDVYTGALERAGYNTGDFELPLMQQVYVGTDEQDAFESPRESAMWYQAMLSSRVPGASEKAPKGYEQWDRIAENMKKIKYEDIVSAGANFGTVEQVIERIEILEKDAGINYYLSWFSFGGLQRELTLASMERFACDVMPAFERLL
jgi:alkanesulfonate monooxygenase SsuD/methylene tetrahydromethanopterin reductase-like flavin-dependent oxidoreductase (luciferase family)